VQVPVVLRGHVQHVPCKEDRQHLPLTATCANAGGRVSDFRCTHDAEDRFDEEAAGSARAAGSGGKLRGQQCREESPGAIVIASCNISIARIRPDGESGSGSGAACDLRFIASVQASPDRI